MRRLISQAEFYIVRRDGAFEMLMSLGGQPKRGPKLRIAKRETALGHHRKVPETHSRHVAHTLTTASGATIDYSAEYSDGRAITADFIRWSLLGDTPGDSYLRQVRILYTDRAMGFDNEDYWSFLPGLLDIASDPMRRCFGAESCPGGKTTCLSPALRQIRQKSAPPTTAPTTRAVSKQGYFSLRKGVAREIRTISNAENRL